MDGFEMDYTLYRLKWRAEGEGYYMFFYTSKKE